VALNEEPIAFITKEEVLQNIVHRLTLTPISITTILCRIVFFWSYIVYKYNYTEYNRALLSG